VTLHFYKEIPVRLPRRKLHALFEALMAEEAKDDTGRIHLVMTTDADITALNRRFRKIDRPTDVLSFNLDEPGEKDAVVGEIYIAVPTARRQAADYGAPLGEELIRLTCHGLLHLFGYDHANPKDETRMKVREDHFLQLVAGRSGR